MTLRTLILLSGCLFFILMQSCEHSAGDMPSVQPKSQTGDSVSYAKMIKPILKTYCYGDSMQKCHVTNSNQGAPGNFTIYSDLKLKIDQGLIQSRVFNTASGGMPPSYSNTTQVLTPNDLDDFKHWVQQGYQNN